jgi:hypothetical protein
VPSAPQDPSRSVDPLYTPEGQPLGSPSLVY